MSINPIQCPPEDVLYAFVDGALDVRLTQGVADHVDRCRSCRSTIVNALSLQGLSNALTKNRLNKNDQERIDRWTALTLPLRGQAMPADDDPSAVRQG